MSRFVILVSLKEDTSSEVNISEPVWLVPQFAMPNLRQTMAAINSLVSKIEATPYGIAWQENEPMMCGTEC